MNILGKLKRSVCCVAIATGCLLLFSNVTVHAQHGGGHGGGHGFGGGHGGGHGFGGGHGIGHGIGHGVGHGIGHGVGHGIGHGVGHGIGHGVGHGIGHGVGHGIGHGIGHAIGHGIAHGGGHHYNSHIDVHASPYYSGYGYSSAIATPYYGYYGQAPVAIVSVPPNTPPYVSAKPAISPNLAPSAPVVAQSSSYQAQAENAFRNSNFNDAARLASHALVDSPQDGKLVLFYSQSLFAVGDYQGAAGAIHRAASLLDPQQWGYTVQNYTRFYRGSGYVEQMARLNEYIKSNPDASYARFLRGYQFGYLGQTEAAVRDLNGALQLESRDQLAAELVRRFGGTPISTAPQEAPAESHPHGDHEHGPVQIDSPPPTS